MRSCSVAVRGLLSFGNFSLSLGPAYGNRRAGRRGKSNLLRVIEFCRRVIESADREQPGPAYRNDVMAAERPSGDPNGAAAGCTRDHNSPARAPGTRSASAFGMLTLALSQSVEPSGQMLVLIQARSGPEDGVHAQAACWALRLTATRPELVGSPAALLYALRTLRQIRASARTGGVLASAVATSSWSLVMSPCRLDDPLPELTWLSAAASWATSPHTLAATATIRPLYQLRIAAC